MELRNIRDDERAAFVLLARYAFHDWTEEEVDAARLAWADPENVWGVFVEAELASALMCFNADQNVRGALKKMGGVSCVATAPQFRGRGHVRALMQAAFEEMRRRGTGVSMLRPFRESFYERFGYVTANADSRVTFPTEALGHWLRREAAPGWTTTPVPAREVIAEIQDFWRGKALPRYHGLIDLPEASEAEWREWVKDKVATFATSNGDRRGFALFKKTGYGHHGKLECSQFLWAEPEARDLLLQFLARHRDQIASVELRLPCDTPFQQWLQDVSRPFQIETFHLPWMVRVMDAPAALAGLPAEAAGEVAVEVVDEQCDWNTGVYLLRSDGGRLAVEKIGAEPAVRMDVKALSALAYGTLPTAELARRGWLAGGEAAALELLDRWFPPRPLFNTIDF
ncbi:MAG: GNAT family N-acetyltransferase [Candidatus Coatesbacteria bacterium]|nr:MAG: GNAT family N-acetyltransferase [Candidatus Coatesbacteria bacterium]